MRSLFFKIFLWFWLAYVLVANVLFLSGMWAQPPGPHDHFSHFMNNMLSLYGRQAVEAFERGGKAGLQAYIKNLRETVEIEARLFTEGETDLAGQPMPPEIRNALRRTGMRPDGDVARREFFPWMVKSLPGTKAPPYTIALKMPPPGLPMELFDRPGVSLLRLGAIMLMAGLVCYGLARYLTAPLRKLQLATRRLAEGDLSARIGAAREKRGDEIGDLGRDFDFMAERIESLMTGQRRLLRDISHELRSPLTRLNVALELARSKAGLEAGVFLDRMEREVIHLNDLIGQLLALARLENQLGGPDHTAINLSDLLCQITDDADFEAQSRNRRVSLKTYTSLTVAGIPGLLRSAIENVVRNAIYYTAEHTTVEVELRQTLRDHRTMAMIQITDHGPGVPESELARIFQPFYRVADSRDRHTGGVGLGLAISERAVRLHGGAIQAANGPTGGLVVEIFLPAQPGPDEPDRASEKTDDPTKE